MLEIGGVFGVIVLALNIWAIISIVGATASTGSKVLWVLLILLCQSSGSLSGSSPVPGQDRSNYSLTRSGRTVTRVFR